MQSATTQMSPHHILQNSLQQQDDKTIYRKDRFVALRRKITTAEQGQITRLSCDIPTFDSALGGGLGFGRVHLVSHASVQHGKPVNSLLPSMINGAVTGFVLALLRKIMMHNPDRPVIWCAPPHAGMIGNLSAEGMRQIGINPAQLIFVHESHPARCMSAFEEALQTDGLAAVVGEYGMLLRQPDLWQRWARRTRRAARMSGTIGMLLGPPASVCGFETGWHISPYVAPLCTRTVVENHDWRPSWQASVHYAKSGRPASAAIKWDWVSAQFLPLERSVNRLVQPLVGQLSDPQINNQANGPSQQPAYTIR